MLITSSPKIPHGAKRANSLKAKKTQRENMLILSFCILLANAIKFMKIISNLTRTAERTKSAEDKKLVF